jgi:hypothetical protein
VKTCAEIRPGGTVIISVSYQRLRSLAIKALLFHAYKSTAAFCYIFLDRRLITWSEGDSGTARSPCYLHFVVVVASYHTLLMKFSV